MNATIQLTIPADEFLDRVFTALIAADVDDLQRLEAQAPFVAAPRSHARFVRNREIFAALLDMSARNLRLLRRISARQSPDVYHPHPS